MAKGLPGKCDSPGMAEIGYHFSTCDSLIESRGPAHLCKINKYLYIHALKLECPVCFLSMIISTGLFVCTQPLWINKWLSGNSSATLPNDGISTVIFILNLCLGKAGAVEAWKLSGGALDGKGTNSSLFKNSRMGPAATLQWMVPADLSLCLWKFPWESLVRRKACQNDSRKWLKSSEIFLVSSH